MKPKKEWWVYKPNGILVAHGVDYTPYISEKRIKAQILEKYGYSEDTGYKIVIR